MRELTVEGIGAWLFETHEHDPIYTALHRARLGHDHLHRWCLAHWCFYSMETACWIADGNDYWGRMKEAAAGRAHRGSERRHFRAQKSVFAVDWFEKNLNKPEDAIPALFDKPLSYTEFQQRLQWPEFGAYFKFKVADVMETVLGLPISFHDSVRFFHDSPVKGAKLVAEDWSMVGLTTQQVVDRLVKHFKSTQAPPRYHRPVGVQEVETLLCAYKEFKTAPKYVANPERYWDTHDTDIAEYRAQLMRVEGPTARKLLDAMPELPA